jgi:hypothetical protein
VSRFPLGGQIAEEIGCDCAWLGAELVSKGAELLAKRRYLILEALDARREPVVGGERRRGRDSRRFGGRSRSGRVAGGRRRFAGGRLRQPVLVPLPALARPARKCGDQLAFDQLA